MYVNNQATKIQRIFRGYYARKVIIPVKKAFGFGREEKLSSVAKGWKIRKIMKTKEIENHIQQIKDYQNAMKDLVGDNSIGDKKIQL